MSIDARLRWLESASFKTPDIKDITEGELEELCHDDMLRLLRGQLDVRVVDEDDGPTLAEAFAAAGVPPLETRPGESSAEGSKRVTDAQLEVYKGWMDGQMTRYAARRAARKAAKAAEASASDASQPTPPVAPASDSGQDEAAPSPEAAPTPPEPPPIEPTVPSDRPWTPPPPDPPRRRSGGCAAGGPRWPEYPRGFGY